MKYALVALSLFSSVIFSLSLSLSLSSHLSLSLSLSQYFSVPPYPPTHAVAFGSPFSLVPQCALYPLLALRESKLLSAGWPAVLPWIYIASLRTLNILRRFDLCETFAKYSGLISATRNAVRGRTRTCAHLRVMRGKRGVSSGTW